MSSSTRIFSCDRKSDIRDQSWFLEQRHSFQSNTCIHGHNASLTDLKPNLNLQTDLFSCEDQIKCPHLKMHFGPCKQCTRTALLQAGLCVKGVIHLKTTSLNKGKCSLPLLRTPASTQAGVPHDCLFVESRIKVKDDIWAFDEVNLEPAREKKEIEKVKQPYSIRSSQSYLRSTAAKMQQQFMTRKVKRWSVWTFGATIARTHSYFR